MKRVFLVALIVLALQITFALASSPDKETQFWSGVYTMSCGDFDFSDNWSGSVIVTSYLNDDGSLNRYHVHGEFLDTLTNLSNGKTLTGRTEGYNFFENVADTPGLWKHAGLMFHFNIPGNGVVNIDAGYMLMYNGEITLVKGKHQFNTGDITALCAALR
jgi:hypothetical protein